MAGLTHDRARILNDEPNPNAQTREPGNRALIRTRVFHLGGIRNAGYYVEVVPIEVSPEGYESFILFSGQSALIEPAARFSAKRLASIVPPLDVIASLRAAVLAKAVR